MRKGWKVFWVICAVTAAVGVGCCVASAALGVTVSSIRSRFPYGIGLVRSEKDIERFERQPYDGEVDDREVLDNVHSIDVQIHKGELQIIRSDTNQVRIETSDIDPRLRLDYYVEDGELTITTAEHFVGNLTRGTVYLFLPQNYRLDEADVEVDTGFLYIEDILADSLDIMIGAGEAQIDHFSANEVTLDCGAGLIKASGAGKEEIDTECGIGEIELNIEGNEEDYSYSVECGVGEVTVGGSVYSGIGASGEGGYNADRELNIHCGMGRTAVSFTNTL